MIGEAIRFNIKHFEPIEHKRKGTAQDIAFALYYAFQCMVALIITRQDRSIKQRSIKTTMYAFLVTICLLVFAMGIPSG